MDFDIKKQPKHPELKRTEQLIDTLFDKFYWRKVCTTLSVCENNINRGEKIISQEEIRRKQQQFIKSGFFKLQVDCATELNPNIESLVRKLADSIVTLIRYEYPPTFIFLFDEVWEIILSMSSSLSKISAGNSFVGDVYAWFVDPKLKQRGWGPHRDRMGSDHTSFSQQKIPKLSTTWLALTEATPLNSCLYVVPAELDPFYYEQDLPNVDPLERIFKGKVDNYQRIKCLPCEPGSMWHFSHKIIHWGSSAICSNIAQDEIDEEIKPRIALSWVIGDPSFEKPAFEFKGMPSLEQRLGLVCGQLINYSGQTGLKKGDRDFYFLTGNKLNNFTEEFVDKTKFLYFMRPPPKRVELKKKNLEKVEIIKATEEDNKVFTGMKDIFQTDYDSTSSEE
eukprot:snap_masked-scaffold_18-processed-gene-6.43-mRNA-1 protein AED:0.04 eAED:0.04 QI:0/0/0/1/1/1/2/0/392